MFLLYFISQIVNIQLILAGGCRLYFAQTSKLILLLLPKPIHHVLDLSRLRSIRPFVLLTTSRVHQVLCFLKIPLIMLHKVLLFA